MQRIFWFCLKGSKYQIYNKLLKVNYRTYYSRVTCVIHDDKKSATTMFNIVFTVFYQNMWGKNTQEFIYEHD